jgi:excisionase family DNA binding protein
MVESYCWSVVSLPSLYCSLTAMPTDRDPAIELLTIAEAAGLLTISVPGMRRLQQQRQIPFIKVGGSVRFSKSDLVSYLKKRRVESIG